MSRQLLKSRPDILNRRRALSRSEIHQLQKEVHAAVKEDGERLLAEINKGGHALGKRQVKFALTWLKGKIWKLNGEMRDTPAGRVFGFREKGVIETMETITFEGLHYRFDDKIGRFRTSPIYRVHSETGATFDYTVDFWGRPEIVA